MTVLEMNHVYKSYNGKDRAVEDFNLKTDRQEFIVLVGPSGCGKSTTLRMIAGLEEITGGEIKIDGEIVNYKTPQERDLAMVFQNYALYPTMNVYDNIAFSLQVRKTDKKVIDEKVEEVAKMLQIENLLDRYPKQLSGGQKQRVAIGSCLIRNPKLFLMDEPLSNLDAKLREQMRIELSELYKKMDATVVYVTHDQVEAMTLGTIIVVMKDGEIRQIDRPENLYDRPADRFVAGFIGSPTMNFIPATAKKKDDGNVLSFGTREIATSKYLPDEYDGKEVVLGIRPEHVNIVRNGTKGSEGVVKNRELLGRKMNVFVDTDCGSVTARGPIDYDVQIGDDIRIAMDPDRIHLFDKDSGKNLEGDLLANS